WLEGTLKNEEAQAQRRGCEPGWREGRDRVNRGVHELPDRCADVDRLATARTAGNLADSVSVLNHGRMIARPARGAGGPARLPVEASPHGVAAIDDEVGARCESGGVGGQVPDGVG